MDYGQERQESTITNKRAHINSITLFIEGTPRSKLRPRTIVNRTNKRGKPWTYNPSVTNEYCDYVRAKAKEFKNMHGLNTIPPHIPITLLLKFHLRRLTTKAGNIGRPDTINLVCNIQDALKGILYEDDAQITCLIAQKVKCQKSKEGVEIEAVAGG